MMKRIFFFSFLFLPSISFAARISGGGGTGGGGGTTTTTIVGSTSSINVRVRNSTAPFVGAGSILRLLFNIEDSDTDNIHSVASNTSRLTANTSGHYSIFANVVTSTPTASSDGQGRDAFILLNGSTVIANSPMPIPDATPVASVALNPYTQIDLQVNDYVELHVKNLANSQSMIISSNAVFGMSLMGGGGGGSTGATGPAGPAGTLTVGNTNYVWVSSGTTQPGAFNIIAGTVGVGGLGIHGILDVDRPDLTGSFDSRSRLTFDPNQTEGLLNFYSQYVIAPNPGINFYNQNNNLVAKQIVGIGNGASYSFSASSCTTCSPKLGLTFTGQTGKFVFSDRNQATLIEISDVKNASFTIPSYFASSMTLSGGKLVQNVVPTTGQVLKFDGTNWAPGTDNNSGGGGLPLAPGDTNYIQNSLSPTTETQKYAVSSGTIFTLLYASSPYSTAGTRIRFSMLPLATQSQSFSDDVQLYNRAADGFVDTAPDGVGGRGGGWYFLTGRGGEPSGGGSSTGGDGGDFIIQLSSGGNGTNDAGLNGGFYIYNATGTLLCQFTDENIRMGTSGNGVNVDGSFQVNGGVTSTLNGTGDNHSVVEPYAAQARYEASAIAPGFGTRLSWIAQRTVNGTGTHLMDVDAVWISTSSPDKVRAKFQLRNNFSIQEALNIQTDGTKTQVGIGSGTITSSTTFGIRTENKAYVGIVIIATTSQTANLLETRNVNETTVTSSITASGGGNFASLKITGRNVCLEDGTNCVVIASSFPATTVTAGTYGSATQVSSITVNAQGLITRAINVTISISTTNMNATGTASASTFLRGDNTWATPAGSGDAVLAATQTWTGGNTFKSSSTFNGPVLDRSNSAGTLAQVLASSGPGLGVYWTTVSGGSSGFSYTFNAMQARSTDTATACAISGSTNALVDTLLCDDTADEGMIWSTTLTPYNSGTLTAAIYFSMTSATSGNVVNDVYVACVADGASQDIDTKAFAAANSATTAVPGTAGYLKVATVTLTNNDSCAAGNLLAIKVRRNGSSGSDTATGDQEIRKVRVYE